MFKKVLDWPLELAVGSLCALAVKKLLKDRFGVDSEWVVWPTLIAVVFLLAYAVKLARQVNFRRMLFAWRMSKWTGVKRAFPIRPYPNTNSVVVDVRQKEIAEASLRGIAKGAGSRSLLLVSGWHYIGCQKHPGVLCKELEHRRPPLKLSVLLLNPDCAEAKQRARKLGTSEERCAMGINAVMYTIAQWREVFNVDIEVRLYGEVPIWQMVITNDEMWLVCARDVPAHESPVYCLDRHAEYSLAWGLYGVWERRCSTSRPVALESITKPDWEKIQQLLVA